MRFAGRILQISLVWLCLTFPVGAAIQKIDGFIQVPNTWNFLRDDERRTTCTANNTLDTEGCGTVFAIPKTGTISTVGFYILTAAGSPSVDARLETVTASTGFPSGTLIGAGANCTVSSISSGNFYTCNLTSPQSVTRGDIIALLINLSSGTSIVTQSALNMTGAWGNSDFPYTVEKESTSWSKNDTQPMGWYVQYDDGSIPSTGICSSATSSLQLDSSVPKTGDGDEVGNLVIPPVDISVGGAFIAYRIGGANNFDIRLYDTDGETTLAVVNIDTEQLVPVTSTDEAVIYVKFPSSITLKANNSYRIVMDASDYSTANVIIPAISVGNSATLEAFTFGTNMYQTDRTDGGSWTDTNTIQAGIGLLVDGLDDGSSITTFSGFMEFPTSHGQLVGNSPTGLTLDAADEKIAAIFHAPKTGNIHKVGFTVGAFTGAATVDVRLESVSAVNGDPTGTLLGANTNASQLINATGQYEVTLTSDASVTANDVIALVVVNPTVSPGNFEVDMADYNFAEEVAFPYFDWYTTSWTKGRGIGPTYVVYDDGTTSPMFSYPTSDIITDSQGVGVNVVFNNSDSPDERGVIFQLPFSVSVGGVWGAFDAANTSADFDVVLYDSDGSTELASASIDVSQTGQPTVMSHFFKLFTSDVTLNANTQYRLTYKPTTTNDVTVYEATFASTAIMASVDGGSNYHLTTRTDGGSWTQTTTERPNIGLLINGASSGGRRLYRTY